MTVIPKKHRWQDFLIELLVYMGNFMIFVFLMLLMTSDYFSNGISAQAINTFLSTYLGLLIFGVVLWVPLGLVCAYFHMTSGSKNALRFILFSDIGLVAALLMIRGSCQTELNFGLSVASYWIS